MRNESSLAPSSCPAEDSWLRSLTCAWILALVGLVVFPSHTQAQDVRIGFKSGLTLSTFRGDTNLITENLRLSGLRRRASFHVGAFTAIELSRRFVLQPELLYVQKGAVLEGSTLANVEATGTYRFAFLQMPLLVKYRIPTGGLVTPFVLAGPTVALNTASGLEVEFSRNIDSELTRFPETNRFSMEGMIGGGVEFDLGDDRTLAATLHYNPSFSDLSPAENVRLRTDALAFSLGYTL